MFDRHKAKKQAAHADAADQAADDAAHDQDGARDRSKAFAKDDVAASGGTATTTTTAPTAQTETAAPAAPAAEKAADKPEKGVDADAANASAETRFKEAEKAYAAKDYKSAAAGYKEVWETSVIPTTDRGQIAYNVAQCHRNLNETEAAIVWYETALTLGGVDKAIVEGHLKSMRAMSEAHVGAVAKYREAQKLFDAKKYDLAAAAFLEAWETPGLDAGNRGPLAVNRAQCLRLLGKNEAAITWYEIALKTGDPDVLANREVIEAHIEALGGKAKSAVKTEETASKDKPEAAQDKTPKPEGGNPAEAEETEANPAAEKKFKRAEAAYKKKSWDRAADLYVEVWQSGGLDDDMRGQVAYNIGQCFRHLGELSKAVFWYELARDSGSSAVEHSALEQNLTEVRQKMEAGEEKETKKEKTAKDEVRADRTQQSADQFAEAQKLYEGGKYAEAIVAYKAVWESNVLAGNERYFVAFNIGQAYKKLGEVAKALAWYDLVLAEGSLSGAERAQIEEIRNQTAGGAQGNQAQAR